MLLKERHQSTHKHPRNHNRPHTPSLLPRAALPRYLTQEEVTRFFSVIPSPRDRALFGLIYHYGLRVEEAMLLTLESVDLKNLHLRIQRLKNGVSSQSRSGGITPSCCALICGYARTLAIGCLPTDRER